MLIAGEDESKQEDSHHHAKCSDGISLAESGP